MRQSVLRILALCGVAVFGLAIPQHDVWAQQGPDEPRVAANGEGGSSKVPPASAQCDGQVWGALFMGTNEASKGTESPDPALASRLTEAFGLQHFYLLGEHTQQIFSEYESWVVPSKDVFLKIDSKGPTTKGDGVNLHLQLWQGKSVLIKTDVVLREQPLFIQGPKWGDGHLIMVVELKPEKKKS